MFVVRRLYTMLFCRHKSEFAESEEAQAEAEVRTYGSFLELHDAWQIAVRSKGTNYSRYIEYLSTINTIKYHDEHLLVPYT